VANRGVAFLRDGGKGKTAWPTFWPRREPSLAWDAVGRAQRGRVGWEWLLVRAYADIEDLASDCVATDSESLRILSASLGDARAAYKATPTADWLRGHYDYAARLAVLRFLRRYGICARMLLVFFCENGSGTGIAAPSEAQWRASIGLLEQELGLVGKSALERRIYKAFLPAI